jgi:tetratricopeptide (TPR) repeat protein
MARLARRALPAAALLAAALAGAVVVRAWIGERSLAEGRAAQRRGNLNGAAAAYRRSLARGNADAAVELARLELLRGDWNEAERSVRAALALAPARAFPHVLRAKQEAARPGPWDDAREESILSSCRKAVSLEPARAAVRADCADLALSLAVTRRRFGEPSRLRSALAEAVENYAEALARDPQASKRLYGRMLDLGGDPAFLADVAFRRGDPGSLPAIVGQLLDRSLWARAEPEFWAAAGERGLQPALAAAAADALARRSLYREGIAAANRGLAVAPGDAGLALRAAELTARLPGREALAAVPLYRGVVAGDPGNLPVRRRLAKFLAAQGQSADAEREARAVVQADPEDAEGWFLLAEILRREGRSAEAEAANREAVDLRRDRAARRRSGGGG